MSIQIRRLGLSKTIEVPIFTFSKTTFRFADNLLLLDKVLVHALFVSLNVERTLAGHIPVIGNGYLTLAGYNNEQHNSKMPLYLFKLDQSQNILLNIFPFNMIQASPLFFKPKLISFRNSFLEFVASPFAILPPEGLSVQLTVFYDLYDEKIHKLNSWGELIEDKKCKK